MINNQLSQKIAFFHILGLLLVIPIHITLEVVPCFNQYFISPLRVFCHAFQPIYFGLAGFLFFQNIKSDILVSYKSKIKGRVRSLVIPYFAWNLMAFGLYLLLVHYGIPSYLVDNFQSLYASKNVIDLIFHVPVDEHLWFIQDLIVVSILSLPLYYILKGKKWYNLLVLVVLAIMVNQVKMASIASFAVGAYVGINCKDLMQKKHDSVWLLMFGIMCTSILTIIQLTKALPLNALFMLSWITALTLWMAYDVIGMRNRLIVTKAGGARKYFFFVYLAHDPLLSIVCKKLSAWSLNGLVESVVLYFVVFAGIIILIALAGFLMDKYLHKLFALLTGGR